MNISVEFPYSAAVIIIENDSTKITEEVSNLYNHVEVSLIERLREIADDLEWYNEKYKKDEN